MDGSRSLEDRHGAQPVLGCTHQESINTWCHQEGVLAEQAGEGSPGSDSAGNSTRSSS